MPFKSSISNKGLLLVSIPLIFELLFVGTLGVLLKQSQEITRKETRSRAVVAEANQLSRCLFDAGSALIAWKYFRSDAFINREKENINQFETGLARLKDLTAEDARQKHHVLKLEVMGHRIIALFNEYQTVVGAKTTYPTLEPLQRLRFIQQGLNPFLSEVQALDKEESNLIESYPLSAKKAQETLDHVLIAGVLINIFITLALAIYFSKEITRRIRVVIENSQRLASKQPLLEAVSGNDEVAEMDSVFHQMAKELAISERKRREIIEMVGHDLRSPLSAIKVTLALLNEGIYGGLSDKGKNRVLAAEQSSERLLMLINDLLDVERLESGTFVLETDDIGMKNAIEDSVAVVKPLADNKRLTIVIECDEELQLEADKKRLAQIMVNILSNAIKFSPEGKAIKINAKALENTVRIEVEDEGPGISAADKERIFEHYQQSTDKDSSSDSEPSSGLGLSICKALIDAHKGTIGVDSNSGHGSTFWFELPL